MKLVGKVDEIQEEKKTEVDYIKNLKIKWFFIGAVFVDLLMLLFIFLIK